MHGYNSKLQIYYIKNHIIEHLQMTSSISFEIVLDCRITIAKIFEFFEQNYPIKAL